MTDEPGVDDGGVRVLRSHLSKRAASRHPRRRLGTIVVLAAAVTLVVAVVWGACSVLQARDQAEAVQATLAATSADAKAMDMEALARDLIALRQQSQSLDSVVSGPAWSAMARLPWVGDDAAAVQVAGRALSTVTRATASLDQLLPQLAPATLRTPDGRLGAATLAASASALRKLSDALSSARDQFTALDSGGLVDPVAKVIERARSALEVAPESIAALAAVAGALGSATPRDYAVLLLNSAEMRGSGGFVGGWALLHVDDGVVSLTSVGANDVLVSAGPLPVSSLPVDYRALWGASSTEWQSVNVSANYPFAAQLTVAGLARLGINVDGVIAIDSKVAAAMMAGTGPITAAGVTVASATADAYFTRAIYDQFPNGVGKDAVALGLFGKMFGLLASGDVDVKAMATALLPLVGERRLLLWSADPREEEALAATPVGGQVPDASGPWSTVALVNGAGNKMDAYLTARVDYVAQLCRASLVPSTVTLGLTNAAPRRLPPYVDQRLDDPSAPKGSTMSLAFVYGPVGSVLTSATLDGRAVPVQSGTERGHPVWRFDIAILRGETRKLVVSFTEPPGSSDQKPVVMAQPMAIPEVTTATLGSCAA